MDLACVRNSGSERKGDLSVTETDAGSLGSARWHIEIKGAREDVTAAADPKGKLLGVDLSRTSRAADYKVITKDELGKAQDALRNVLGENTKVLEIIIYEKYLMCSVPNPQNPNVQDSYQYGINGLTNKELVKMPTPVAPSAGFPAVPVINTFPVPPA